MYLYVYVCVYWRDAAVGVAVAVVGVVGEEVLVDDDDAMVDYLFYALFFSLLDVWIQDSITLSLIDDE